MACEYCAYPEPKPLYEDGETNPFDYLYSMFINNGEIHCEVHERGKHSVVIIAEIEYCPKCGQDLSVDWQSLERKFEDKKRELSKEE